MRLLLAALFALQAGVLEASGAFSRAELVASTRTLGEAYMTRLQADAAHDWDWQLVLVSKDTGRRLTDAEIALLLAHEMAQVIFEHMLERVSALAAARPARITRVADVLRMMEEEWYVVRELEPLMQAQEREADRIGMAIVCAAVVVPSRALTLFNKMARSERGLSYIKSHGDALERRLSLEQHAGGCPE